jgi:hypothetical protein
MQKKDDLKNEEVVPSDLDKELAETVNSVFNDLASRQESLPPEMEEILYCNLDKLYLD